MGFVDTKAGILLYLQACIVCIFAFLFLVPFVLDPAISTIMHEFTEEPVVCKVNNITIKKGKSQCNWSSCREGCTATIYTCFQVTTNNSCDKISSEGGFSSV